MAGFYIQKLFFFFLFLTFCLGCSYSQEKENATTVTLLGDDRYCFIYPAETAGDFYLLRTAAIVPLDLSVGDYIVTSRGNPIFEFSDNEHFLEVNYNGLLYSHSHSRKVLKGELVVFKLNKTSFRDYASLTVTEDELGRIGAFVSVFHEKIEGESVSISSKGMFLNYNSGQ